MTRKKRASPAQIAARKKFAAAARSGKFRRRKGRARRRNPEHGFQAGDRVELHPGLDLWMRGAKYGTIQKIGPDGVASVRMDHKSVRKLQRIPADRLKLISRGVNPKRRSSAPLSGFQVAALKGEKILFLSGVALSTSREAASNFGSVKVARRIANQVRNVGRRLGISKVAVVTKHDTPAEIKRFLLGGA